MATPFPSLTKTWHTHPYPAIDPSRPELSLSGKAAIITGGSGTIGKATALAFARAGVKHVSLIGRNLNTLTLAKAELNSSYPETNVSIYSADVTSTTSIHSAVAKIRVDAGQPIDILVNNAGFLPTPTSIMQAKTEDWWTSFNVNVLGSFIITQEFISVSAPSAVLINISSGIAHIPPLPGVSGYAASKIATAKMFEYLQKESPQIRVVNVQPGVVASDMNRKHGYPSMDHGLSLA